jgi:hypothetical protein
MNLPKIDNSNSAVEAKYFQQVSDVYRRDRMRAELSQRIGRLLARHWLRANGHLDASRNVS